MMSSKVDSAGRKIADRGNKSLSTDVVKLLKTQDAGYIRTMLQMVRKEREELEKRIVLADEEAKVLRAGEKERSGKHTVYVGKKEEQENFDKDTWFGAGGEWPDREGVRNNVAAQQQEESDEEVKEAAPAPKKLSKKQQAVQELAEREERAFMKKRSRAHERALEHLEAIKARERDLATAEEELEKQRAKMNNTIGGVNKNGVKFKIRERKR